MSDAAATSDADVAAIADPVAAAEEAGLRYVTDDAPGIRRVRRGRGFSYTVPDGRPVDGATRERIGSLAVPPAWTEVWICPDPLGHVQATGRDDRGRKQYRYHPRWHQVRDEAKFDRLSAFGEALPEVRSTVSADLARPGLPPEKVVALVLALMDRTLIRVGNEEYRRDNGTYGLTTLGAEHVEVEGSAISFCFLAKGGHEHEVTIRDRRLARAVRACHELGGRELFTYRGPDGDPVRVDSADCNDYLAAVAGAGTTVKVFRTWGGTVTALEALLDRETPLGDRDVVEAVDAAAERLGNTRAVCRRSYLHPVVTDELDERRLRDAWRRARATSRLSRAERALLLVLEG